MVTRLLIQEAGGNNFPRPAYGKLTFISADSRCTEAGALPPARPRPRGQRDIAAGERTALVVEDAQARDLSPGTPVGGAALHRLGASKNGR